MTRQPRRALAVLWLVAALCVCSSALAAPRAAVLGHMNYEGGYLKRLKALKHAFDKLSAKEFRAADLSKYQAVFVALGVGRIGINGGDQRKLTQYVRDGGVLVLEFKARIGMPPLAYEKYEKASQWTVAPSGAKVFTSLKAGETTKYNGRVFFLTPHKDLDVLLTAGGRPITVIARVGKGLVLYNSLSLAWTVQCQKKAPTRHSRMLDGVITWAMTRTPDRQRLVTDEEVAAAMAGPDRLPRGMDWKWNIRAISLRMSLDMSEEDMVRAALRLRKQGVNTILDSHSYQYLPNLPEKKHQYTRQVKFEGSAKFRRAMHRAGLRVINHTTSTFVPIEAMKRPEYDGFWSCDIRTGKVALRPAKTGYSDCVFADLNDPGWRKVVLGRMQEYQRRVQPDAFMTDEVEWLPDITSGGSKRGSWAKFRKRYGFGYPKGDEVGNYGSKAWRAYLKFRMDSGGEFYTDLTKRIREENPHALVTGCLAGISKPWRRTWAMGGESWLAGWSLGFYEMEEACGKRAKRGSGFLYSTVWPTYYREMALFNAAAEANGYWVTYSLGYPQTWRVKDSEQFYAWALCMTMGHRYWMRDYQAEYEWFQWEQKHEKDLIKPRWIGDVGILFPEHGRDYRADSSLSFEDWAGISESLAEHHVMADQLLRRHIEENRLDRFKLIIIPSEPFLSRKMAANLKRFVERGGTLVVTGDTAVGDVLKGPGDAARLRKRMGLVMGVGPLAERYDNNQWAFAKTAGLVMCHPARIGRRAYQSQWQAKLPGFKRDADHGYRKSLASLIARQVKRRRVEVKGLPTDVMVNAYDTYGHGDDQPRRTIHLLDSIGGMKDGDPWPMKAKPLEFVPIAKRNGGRPITILLRDIQGVTAVKLISPDFEGEKPLKAVYDKAARAYRIDVPSAELGRYSAVVAALATK